MKTRARAFPAILARMAVPAVMMVGTAIFASADVINDDISTRTEVTWATDGHLPEKPVRYVQRITVKGDLDFDRLCFNQFARRMEMVNPLDTLEEIVPGYYSLKSPRLNAAADSVVFEIMTYGRLVNRCYAPEGFHRVNHDSATEPVRVVREELTKPSQWQYLGNDDMVYGPTIYDFNLSLATDAVPGVYDIIPSFKKIELTGGNSTVSKVVYDCSDAWEPEHYQIVVKGDSVVVRCRPEDKAMAFAPFAAKVLGGKESGVTLPDAVIDNYPDMPWRGLMIDIARNYQTPATMHGVLNLMAANHLNKLHFHVTDDEAWRLEIPGLPELTEVGAHRGYSVGRNDILPQIFAGDGNPESTRGSANGYFTRRDFIDLIKEAKRLGIDVVPEIESPGHARAAIKAMELRHLNGDDTYRLIHDGDSSRYTSAQAFHDNVMNPALPGTYKFMEKVIDEIAAMYRKAGVPLTGIHIGGDEVAEGAWNGSEVAQKFMAERGLTSQHQFHACFVERVAKMLAERGIPMHGWQEIALGHSQEYNEAVRPATGGINCWSTLAASGQADVTDRALRGGWPVILSNVDHLYFDMSYTTHPQEPGLRWGGTTDEFAAFEAYPSSLCPASDSIPGVIGLNAQIFAETLRTPEQLYIYLVPKIYGLSERAWNSKPTYSQAAFNAIIEQKELPMLTSDGIAVHVRQPGVKVENGMVYMNSPYAGAEIRYTTDGSEPTAASAVYTEPFALAPDMENVKATLTYCGYTSLPTLLHP